MSDERLADQLLLRLSSGPVREAQATDPPEISGLRLKRALASLTARGYLLEHKEGVVRLVGSHDLLLAEHLEPVLRGRRFGLPLFSYGRLGSTNEAAARLAQAEAPEGALVTAEEQLRGRGRQGRTWHSPPGVGIWMSLVLRPRIDPDKCTGIPLLGALAIAHGIERVTGARPELKWPNDVYLDGRKVAGVLGESAVEGTRVRFAVLGMGINVNLPATSLPPELSATAGSLAMATGRTWDRVAVLAAILLGLEERYDAYVTSGFSAIREEFLSSSHLVGRPVEVIFPHGSVSGTVLDMAGNGELVLATDGGTSQVRVGEASLRVK